jgi:hypothetical protein
MSKTVEERKNVTPGMDNLDFMVLMSEGNPGALNVLMKILHEDYVVGFVNILSLDDMNIRGTQIWVGYKDYCGEKLDSFIEAIRTRDQEMVDVINKEGRRGNHTAKAVTSGASQPGARQNL